MVALSQGEPATTVGGAGALTRGYAGGMSGSRAITKPNIHIIGLAGSGKTTLAEWCSSTFEIPSYDLDWVVYDDNGEREAPEIRARVDEIIRGHGWVAEGAYHDAWVTTLLEQADSIVWLDVPVHTCAYRIFARHVRAELRGKNKHPGWRKLARFLDYTRRTAKAQRAATRALVSAYSARVVRCTSSRAVRELQLRLSLNWSERRKSG